MSGYINAFVRALKVKTFCGNWTGRNDKHVKRQGIYAIDGPKPMKKRTLLAKQHDVRFKASLTMTAAH